MCTIRKHEPPYLIPPANLFYLKNLHLYTYIFAVMKLYYTAYNKAYNLTQNVAILSSKQALS
jgi:hypothetical protein